MALDLRSRLDDGRRVNRSNRHVVAFHREMRRLPAANECEQARVAAGFLILAYGVTALVLGQMTRS